MKAKPKTSQSSRKTRSVATRSASLYSIRIWCVIVLAITPIAYNALIAQDGIPQSLKNAEYQKAQAIKHQTLIRNIQTELKTIKLYQGAIDGKIGKNTRQALNLYYQKYGLDPTIKPSQKILDHMIFNRHIIQAAQTDPIPINQNNKTQRQVIRIIQIGLSELGYQPGPIDGQISAQTKNAIRQFQKHRNIKQDGKPSQKILDELKKITGISQIMPMDDNPN